MRLECRLVGSNQAKINGWAFTHFDGKAYWDKSGAEVTAIQRRIPRLVTVWKAQKRKKDLPDAVWRRLRGKTPDKWTDAEQKEAFVLWIERVYAQPPKVLADLKAEKTKLAGELDVISKNTAITFVMADLPKPRQSYVMIRGQYNQPGEKVSRNVPSFLPPLPAKPKERDYNRLDFANWLVSGQHPLTARVAVNRMWQQFFGTGLVKTSADFGTQGDLSHPSSTGWPCSSLDAGYAAADRLSPATPTPKLRRHAGVTGEGSEMSTGRGPPRLDAEVLRELPTSVD